MTARGGVVAAVDPGSPADESGLRTGDVIEAVAGTVLTDVLAWSWASAEDQVEVLVSSEDAPTRALWMTRSPSESWGVEFENAVFDGVRTCRNDCTFCFLGGLPPGLRPSLYVRDDDYRLSFLFGNFITLTNIDDKDVDAITQMRLTPLYVSVHATDPGVRRRLLCPRGEDRGLERLDELLAAGTEVHAQIVLVGGVNDGAVLQDTLEWLASRPGVLSVGVVPAASTKHVGRAGTRMDGKAAAGLLDHLHPWRRRMRAERGRSWVHSADEVWLAAGRELPAAADYDGYPQFENGIGLVRSFLDETGELERRQALGGDEDDSEPRRSGPPRVLVTGTLFAPVLDGLVRSGSSDRGGARVLPVTNRYLGGDVSVAGLLTGEDIVRTILEDGPRGEYFVPEIVFNDDGLTLDDMTLDALGATAGAVVRSVPSDASGLLAASADADTRNTERS